MVASNRYDVVVTDLQMPNGHGHALAMDLLALQERPAIVILTGMLDPRLVKDLVGRGVDFVDFKPVRYDLFVAKIKAMVDRRRGIQPDYVASLIFGSWIVNHRSVPRTDSAQQSPRFVRVSGIVKRMFVNSFLRFTRASGSG